MDLSIIIINWKSVTYLRNCLKSVFQHAPDLEFEVIVVDNHSGDGCCRVLAEEYPQVLCFESEKNIGFAGANNLGYSYSSGKALLFLNPDTEIRGNAIGVLYSTLIALPDAGAVGGTLLNTDLTVQTTSILPYPTLLKQIVDMEWLKKRFFASTLLGIRPLFTMPKKPVDVEALSGACIMVTREIFAQIGLFSTDYFMYAEDLDLCFKIRRAGKKVLFVSSAHVVHHGGGSTGQNELKNYNVIMMRRADLIFLRKYHTAVYIVAYHLTTVVIAVIRLAVLGISAPFHGRAGIRKWAAIFRWSLGVEPWAGRLQFRKPIADQ